MASTEGITVTEGRIEVVGLQRITPYALPAQTRLEALHTYNSEQQPEKADKKRNADKEWGGLLQAS